jgi:hypothetical protein
MFRLTKVALCAALFLGVCGQAKAITLQASWLPANNFVAIVADPSANTAMLDAYKVVATGKVFFVVKGTPALTVQNQANLSSAYAKFVLAMGPQMNTNMSWRLACTRWFYQNVAPLYAPY